MTSAIIWGAAALAYPGHVTTQGWAAADRFWTQLRAAFPSAAFEVHHTAQANAVSARHTSFQRGKAADTKVSG